MNESGEVKITDFGLSNVKNREITDIGKNTSFDTICGTILYLSPERLKEKSYGYDCDLWSTGLVLVELFTGRHPQETFKSSYDAFCDFNEFINHVLESLKLLSASS